MTDREPTPREEAALRRLLRDARHDGPVPPEVAARTEETLAALGAGDRTDRTVPTGPTDRAAASPGGAEHHRRRRAATALLVAAVSVVVVGIGIGQVVSPAADDQSGAASSGNADAEARDTPPDRAAVGEGRTKQGTGGPDAALTEEAEGLASEDRAFRGGGARRVVPTERLGLVSDPPAVRASRFARDVTVVRRLQQAERPGRLAGPDAAQLAPLDPAPGFTCEGADWGAGRPVAVRYEQAPGVLVLRPPTRATQVVDLLECGSGDVVRSVTLSR